MKVLLVENKDICIDALMAILTGSSEQVEACHTLEEAEQRIRVSVPDVVIVDRELANDPSFHSRFKSVAYIIITSELYMDKVRQWVRASDEILVPALNKAAQRKDAINRIESLLANMRQRTTEAARLGEAMPVG